MAKKLHLPSLMAIVVALFSSRKKVDPLLVDCFTVTSQVLEAAGGKVPATINGKFPEKYFKRKAVVEVIPVLKWNGGEARGQSAVFQGEKIEGSNQTISYKVGGSYMMKTSFDYVPEIAESELRLGFRAKVGKKEAVISAVKVVDGVISTSELVNNTLGSANPALGEDAFQRIIKEKHDANVMSLVQQANIRPSKLKIAKEFDKEVANINEAANKEISNIEASVYTFPDGDVSLNVTLAENRESDITKMPNKDLKKAKIDASADAECTTQDWGGFQELASKSNIQDKELILRVLSIYQDPAQREQEIKNISSVYKNLADDILPQLRRSRSTLNYEIIGKSDEEITKLAPPSPSELNIEELLYAVTLTNDPAKQEAIYIQATKQSLNDYCVYNNLGKFVYQAGSVDKAGFYLKKAVSVDAALEVNMNLGLISLIKGDKAVTEAYFGKIVGIKEFGESMGNLYIAQGQYERVANSFGDAKTNSAVLAQILAKDYNKAKNTLAGAEKPDTYTDYLMAVLGVRTNDSSTVTSSLKSAVAKEPTLAKEAAADLEFSKSFTNVDFMSIIK